MLAKKVWQKQPVLQYAYANTQRGLLDLLSNLKNRNCTSLWYTNKLLIQQSLISACSQSDRVTKCNLLKQRSEVGMQCHCPTEWMRGVCRTAEEGGPQYGFQGRQAHHPCTCTPSKRRKVTSSPGRPNTCQLSYPDQVLVKFTKKSNRYSLYKKLRKSKLRWFGIYSNNQFCGWL